MKITYITDLVSPYCWAGALQIEEAMKVRPDDYELVISSYQLTPDVADSGIPFADYVESLQPQFNHQAEAYIKEVTAALAPQGVELNIDKIETWPNTLKGHALWQAAPKDKQWGFFKALISGFFRDGKKIGEERVLLEMAEQLGLDGAALKEKLADKKHLTDVKEQVQSNYAQGIKSVPTFLFNDKYIVSGAIGAEELASVMDQIAAKEQSV
jgi:predicted DsbA family dithiol-disulfide isomerase